MLCCSAHITLQCSYYAAVLILCYSAHIMLQCSYYAMLQCSYYAMLQCSYYANIDLQACKNQRATFTPLCVSVDGMLGSEAEFLSRDWVTFWLQDGKDVPYSMPWDAYG